jgi:hypothetical protein
LPITTSFSLPLSVATPYSKKKRCPIDTARRLQEPFRDVGSVAVASQRGVVHQDQSNGRAIRTGSRGQSIKISLYSELQSPAFTPD